MAMENQAVEVVITSVGIALPVAAFLLNSDRVQKAIEMLNECLILLNNTNQNSKDEFISLSYLAICNVLFFAYRLISDDINAERFRRKLLFLCKEYRAFVDEGDISMALAEIAERQNRLTEAKQFYEKTVKIKKQTGAKFGEADAYVRLGNIFCKLRENLKAEECIERALAICTKIGDKRREAFCYQFLGIRILSLKQYEKAIEYLEKALVITAKLGDRKGEADTYWYLAIVFDHHGQYHKAKECLYKALVIRTEVGDRKGEAFDYICLGMVFLELGICDRAKECLVKALVISTEINYRRGEAVCNAHLGQLFQSLAQYDEALEHYQKAHVIKTEIGDIDEDVAYYNSLLATVFYSLGKYDKAIEYIEKALIVRTETGNRIGEAACYDELGGVLGLCGKYEKAIEYHEKALRIRIEIGHRAGEAASSGNLGIVFHLLGKCDKAKEYLERSLFITREIGHIRGEAANYGNLGSVFLSLGRHEVAKEYLEKSLEIRTKIGDRRGEAMCYGSLAALFQSVGQDDKAIEYREKSLVITTKIGDRNGTAADYGGLGVVYESLGQCNKAKEYLEKALVIRIEIGHRVGEAADNTNLSDVFRSLGQYDKAKEYLEKALVISAEIGHKEGESAALARLGNVSRICGDYEASEVCLERALSISRDIGDKRGELQIFYLYAILYLSQNKIKDSVSYLHQCIEKYEELRLFLGINDQFKISFLEQSGKFSYKLLSRLLCDSGNVRDALYVEELSRARGLSDLMAEEYSVKTHISANPQSWFGIENILKKEKNCTCLYISYFENRVNLWILKTSGAIHFKQTSIEETLVQAGLPEDLSLGKFLAYNFRSFGVLPIEACEDRSLNMVESQRLSLARKSSARFRLVEEDEEVISSLSFCYKAFIVPVYDLLEEPEVIIVPERRLYRVPFSALRGSEGAEYLAETHRIRVIPSLTTLKIIQDSPEDYHSNTGALIIGNPKVDWLSPLPGARREAEMVGRLVGIPPLVEGEATKQVVLDRISSVSLIHIAAHGNPERGQIALSPIPTLHSRNTIRPPEETYMLTMADVSRVKVRAKLVVLSCCHSGRGEVRAEGVIGIARAFLGSGARSVLVALWAIPDAATEKLMSRFYEHLVSGKSASESLREAMKWLRNNGFTKVSEWASFSLIGDDVKFEFGKPR